jgi:DNA-binding transcriptional MerR regulator
MREDRLFEETQEERRALFTIGETAREFRVSLRTLRFYEDRGLLRPLRNGLSRLYSIEDRLRLAFVLKCRRFGFTLNEIGSMIGHQAPDDSGTALALPAEQIRAQIGHLEHQREKLEIALADLRRVCAEPHPV